MSDSERTITELKRGEQEEKSELYDVVHFILVTLLCIFDIIKNKFKTISKSVKNFQALSFHTICSLAESLF